MLIPRSLGQLGARAARHSVVRRQQSLTRCRAPLGHCVSQQRWTSQSRDQPPSTESASDSAGREDGQDEKVQGLPAPGEGYKLDVSGEGSSVSLGHLGPLVVNRDGTTGRVANWETMTVHEKETTLALLKKRNKARLDVLKKDEETKS